MPFVQLAVKMNQLLILVVYTMKKVWNIKLEENRPMTALSGMKGNLLKREMMGCLLSYVVITQQQSFR